MRVILLDIEGTTTPVDYVYNILFPYARLHLADYLQRQATPVTLTELKQEYERDKDPSKPEWKPLAYINHLMDKDSKAPVLKKIQGEIYKAGFEQGSLKSELYPDVIPALKRWHEAGKMICIFSSGSVQAQRLLFTHTTEGNLTGLIDAFFDTAVGPKKEAPSYREIARRLHASPEEILFISDSQAECEAASDAGCLVRYSVRPGNDVQSTTFERLESFDALEQ